MQNFEDLLKTYQQQKISRRNFLRRAAILGMSGSAMAFLTGCPAGETIDKITDSQPIDSPTTVPQPQRGGHLVVAGAGSSTDSLDPTTYDSFFNGHMGASFGNRLVRLGNSGELIPRLATEWRVSDDLKVWTIQIRKDVTFHNGKSLTAEDVVYSLKRHFGPSATSGAVSLFSNVSSIQANGSHEVKISLSQANLDFIYLLTDYHLVIQPVGATDDGIGTGPFIIDSFEPGVRAVFSRNPNYWNGDKPYYDSLEVLVINDAAARAAAVQTGKAHAIDRVDPKIADSLKAAGNVQIFSTPSRGHYNFIAQTDTNPFSNQDVMLALKYALPRQQIIDQALNGFGEIGNDHPINKGFSLFENAVAQRLFDLDKAAFHYNKSGHSGPIVLENSSATWPGANQAANIFSQEAKKAGIDIQVKTVPADGYWSDVWNVRPFCASYWISRLTQDSIMSVAYTGQWNETRFDNARFKELLPKARVEGNESTRAAMYSEMQQLIHDNSGSLIPVHNAFIDAISTKIKGFEGSRSQTLGDQLMHESTWFDS